jgi:hypothetical protein
MIALSEARNLQGKLLEKLQAIMTKNAHFKKLSNFERKNGKQ